MTAATIALLLSLACQGDESAYEHLQAACAAEPESGACVILREDWDLQCPAWAE